MTIRTVLITAAVAVCCSNPVQSNTDGIWEDGSNAVAEPMLLADNRRKDRRDDRKGDRGDRRDCRQDEGVVGKDKRECKQENVHGRDNADNDDKKDKDDKDDKTL
jgi:hypothetical protein